MPCCHTLSRTPLLRFKDVSNYLFEWECAWALDALVSLHQADSFTPLHFAANLGLHRLVVELLRRGVRPDPRTCDVSSLHEPGGRTPLHLAAAAGQKAIAKVLVGHDADPLCQDWQGCVFCLCQLGILEFVVHIGELLAVAAMHRGRGRKERFCRYALISTQLLIY